jgi:hypothetical protein
MSFEQLCRWVKSKEVYPQAYGSVSAARASLGWYLAFCNPRRLLSGMGARTAGQAYLDLRVAKATAKRCLSTGREATSQNRNAVAENRAPLREA